MKTRYARVAGWWRPLTDLQLNLGGSMPMHVMLIRHVRMHVAQRFMVMRVTVRSSGYQGMAMGVVAVIVGVGVLMV